MRVGEPTVDLLDRFDVVVDPDAEPIDVDEVVAEFLLNYVRDQSTSAGAPTVDRQVTDGGAKEGVGS